MVEVVRETGGEALPPTRAARMLRLYEGQTLAYQTFALASGKKASGKAPGQYRVVREPITEDLVESHLAAERGIGLFPVRDDSTVSWCAIDIDTYPLDHSVVAGAVKKHKLPAIIVRSKSGGAHVTFFLTEPMDAGIVRDKLAEIAAGMGYATAEVFPKQSTIRVDEGDLGSALNLPYCGADRSNRHAFCPDGKAALSLDEFLDLGEKLRITPAVLAALHIEALPSVIVDGPPCLEAILSQGGFPPQERNSGLFSMAVYFKKAHPDDWVERLEAFNQDEMHPPKDDEEVRNIVRGHERKDYGYKCHDMPLRPYCNRSLCLTRKFGIGGAGAGLPQMSGLTKLETEPPLWFLEVEGIRVEFSTEELQTQRLFQRKVMDAANIMMTMLKTAEWGARINELMGGLTIIPAPPEASVRGEFLDLVEQFCSGRFQARVVDEILLGKPFTESGKTVFRLSDLMSFLREARFTIYGRNRVVSRLKEIGACHVAVRVAGAQKRVWQIPAFERAEPVTVLPEAATPF